jgi:glycosyltransferase involved in cell wall biosynthesis
MSSQVVAGNEYLADYARRYNDRVCVIPTCIDTTKFVPRTRPDSDRSRIPLVGWIGSHTTAKYLEDLLPVLARAAKSHPFRLYVVGSATPIRAAGLEVLQAPWALAREVEDFQRCDVGAYPLRDDDWCRGKCGFKAIQFMACGVPVVASAVGVNREIIRDGENGFLAATQEEWVEKLCRVLTDRNLRERLGSAGRQTIEEKYSLALHADRVVEAFWDALKSVRGNDA